MAVLMLVHGYDMPLWVVYGHSRDRQLQCCHCIWHTRFSRLNCGSSTHVYVLSKNIKRKSIFMWMDKKYKHNIAKTFSIRTHLSHVAVRSPFAPATTTDLWSGSRSEERRVGKEWVSTFRSRGSTI